MKSMLNKSEIKGKIGAFYGRVSTNAQDLNMQQESCQFFIQKYECSINHRYTEELSATRNPLEKRKELIKLIADAHEGLFDFVVIYNHDRLARNPIEHLKIRRIFNEIGIPVYASSTESNYSYKDILSNALRDNYSKVEADNIRVRMKDSILTRVHQGKWTGGKLPYGVEYVNPLQELNIDSKKKLRFVKDKILVIQKIYELYISGFGFKAIANFANEHKLDTGFLWSKERVKFIVTNPIYAGYLSIYKRKAKSTSSTNDKNSWEIHKIEELEPIIDKHLWEQCFELYRSRKEKEVSNPRYLTTPYLLKDIIRCKNCSRKLLTKDQRSKGYGEKIYYCSGNEEEAPCGIRIKADDLDRVFVGYLSKTILGDIHKTTIMQNMITQITEYYEEKVRSLLFERHEVDQAIRKLESQIIQVEQQLTQIVKLDAEKAKDEIKNLQMYHSYNMNKKETLKTKLVELNQEVDRIQLLHMDEESLKILLRTDKPFKDCPQHVLRRMLTYLIPEAVIDRSGKISIKSVIRIA